MRERLKEDTSTHQHATMIHTESVASSASCQKRTMFKMTKSTKLPTLQDLQYSSNSKKKKKTSPFQCH